jgi:hypothetical protein
MIAGAAGPAVLATRGLDRRRPGRGGWLPARCHARLCQQIAGKIATAGAGSGANRDPALESRRLPGFLPALVLSAAMTARPR